MFVRVHSPERPKYLFRGASDNGGPMNTQIPIGSSPCHSSVPNCITPMRVLR
jgi:hypothetical protein